MKLIFNNLHKSLILAIPIALCLITASNAHAGHYNHRQQPYFKMEYRTIKLPPKKVAVHKFKHKKTVFNNNRFNKRHKHHIKHCKAMRTTRHCC
jgi:hypothetical protein